MATKKVITVRIRGLKQPVSRVKIPIDASSFKPSHGFLGIPTGTGQTALLLEVIAFPGIPAHKRIHGKPSVADGGLLVYLVDPFGTLIWTAHLLGTDSQTLKEKDGLGSKSKT